MRVKLPKEVAEAIEEFRRCGETDHDLLSAVLGSADSKAATTIRRYIHSSGGFYNVLGALINGYEVEETPEEKVQDYIMRLRNVMHHVHTTKEDSHRIGFEIQGALKVLDLLNIKIDGVNT